MRDREILERLRGERRRMEERRVRNPAHTRRKVRPWLVLDADWGGQVLLTVPWHLVGENTRIATLLADLNALAWPVNQGDGADAYLYDPTEYGLTVRDGVAGGMGGGALERGLWVNGDLLRDPRRKTESARVRAIRLLDLQL